MHLHDAYPWELTPITKLTYVKVKLWMGELEPVEEKAQQLLQGFMIKLGWD